MTQFNSSKLYTTESFKSHDNKVGHQTQRKVPAKRVSLYSKATKPLNATERPTQVSQISRRVLWIQEQLIPENINNLLLLQRKFSDSWSDICCIQSCTQIQRNNTVVVVVRIGTIILLLNDPKYIACQWTASKHLIHNCHAKTGGVNPKTDQV
jgi:hypothetical protein